MLLCAANGRAAHPAEIAMHPTTGPAAIPEDLIATVRSFSFALGNGTLDREVLPREIDYRQSVVQFGSELELIYNIFLRNLTLTASGEVGNSSYAQRRAAQWIRSYCDPDYVVDPPLSDHEQELA
jgi:hypothetical protein